MLQKTPESPLDCKEIKPVNEVDTANTLILAHVRLLIYSIINHFVWLKKKKKERMKEKEINPEYSLKD